MEKHITVIDVVVMIVIVTVTVVIVVMVNVIVIIVVFFYCYCPGANGAKRRSGRGLLIVHNNLVFQAWILLSRNQRLWDNP